LKVAVAYPAPHMFFRGAGGGLEHMGTVDDGNKTNLKTKER
jgi:hypothetical protein